jgi:RHS repeat-associated protein
MKGTGAVLPELDIQDATRVVSRFRESDGIGGVFETTYAYEGLRWDLDRRTTLGFARITATNLDSGITTVTDYEQSFPLAMQPKRIERRRSSDGLLLESSDLTYAVTGTIGAGPVSAFLQSRIDESYNLGDARLLVSRSMTRAVDGYGNVTTETVETNDVENGEVRKTVTTATYSNDTLNWWIGQRLSKSTEFWLNGGMTSAQTQTTAYTYSPTTGLLETVTREPGAGAGIEFTTTHTHDAFGNVLTETVAGPALPARTTTYGYDARGQFPLTQTNALGHVTTATWDPVFGKRLSQSDPNGLTTTWSYDSFGNLELETRPDGTSVSTLRYEDPTGSGVFAAHYVEVIESGKPVKRVFVDRLGRTVREETLSFDGTKVLVDTEYDSKGRVLRKSDPYFAGSSPVWNVFAYDLLGRVTALIAADPVQSSTTVYDGFSAAVTDNANRTETTYADAAGRVIRVIARDGTELQLSYDAQGNRTRARAATGTAVQSDVDYSYDRYGRLLQQDDPDHGVYTYSYDALGQKLSEVSPMMAAAAPPQSRTFTYDLLGRMTSRTEPEGTTTWDYDDTAGGSLGVGQLTRESQPGFVREFTYASAGVGRLTGTTTLIGSTQYDQALSYDANGKLASETYPASAASPLGFVVEYSYNALGLLERVQNQGGSEVYYQTLATDAQGRKTSEWLGDGSTVIQSYAGTSGRITSQQSQGAATIQAFAYSYDAAGNMLTRSDNVQTLSETFTYDNLDRLTSAQVSGQAAVQYAFDAAGSITQKSDVADSYDYLMGPAHAVSLVTLGATMRAFTYDANGNFALGTGEPTILWSSYNKPTSLTKGGVQYLFDYGPDRKRYRKQRNGETTHYIGGRFEYRSGGGQTLSRHVIQAHGRAILVREDISAMVTEKYLHRDHLGSITAITSSTGAVLERLSYDAWGQRRVASTWQAGTVTTSEHRGYTGHEHLDDIGVIHMNGRIYSPSLGRILSPDPVTQAPQNGQNYNRYTYAFNNPLRYTDPSGYQVDELINGQGDGGEDPAGGYNIVVGVDYPNVGSCGHQSQGGPCNDLDNYSDFLMDQYNEQRRLESSGCRDGLALAPGSCIPAAQIGDKASGDNADDYQVDYVEDDGIRPSYLIESVVLFPWRIVGGVLNAGRLGAVRGTTGLSNGALRVGDYTLTGTVAGHINQVVSKGPYAGELARPYLSSPHTIQQIVRSGAGVRDPGGVPGALRFDVAGTFRGSGTWELVIHPRSGIVYHFNFVK